MARATQSYTEIAKTVIEKVPTITLELTADEAKTLAVILCKVAGSPWHSPRKHANSIDTALKTVGYYFDNTACKEIYGLLNRSAGIVDFLDYEEE